MGWDVQYTHKSHFAIASPGKTRNSRLKDSRDQNQSYGIVCTACSEETRDIVPQELCCPFSLFSFRDYIVNADHAQAVIREVKHCPQLERFT